jgi:uncharacterized membrane protein YeaQ/YmgE (transglycosylase-associated protein family)
MPDDGGVFGLAVAALVDAFVSESAKRKRWARIVRGAGALLLLAVIGAAVYVTLKYS